MYRNFKFRVYDIKEKLFLFIREINFQNQTASLSINEGGLTLMHKPFSKLMVEQSTGYVDRWSKEIFVNDIIIIYKPHINESILYHVKNLEQFYYDLSEIYNLNNMELVGNIHEGIFSKSKYKTYKCKNIRLMKEKFPEVF